MNATIEIIIFCMENWILDWQRIIFPYWFKALCTMKRFDLRDDPLFKVV